METNDKKGLDNWVNAVKQGHKPSATLYFDPVTKTLKSGTPPNPDKVLTFTPEEARRFGFFQPNTFISEAASW